MTSVARFGTAALLVLVGVILVLAFDGVAVQAVGVGLIAVGLVAAVSLVFYEVGLSEDRQRERDAKPPRRTGGGPPPWRFRRR